MRYHFTPTRMAFIKKIHKKTSAREGVEKREPSYIVAGNVNWYSHYGFPGGSDGKESACIAGDLGSTPFQIGKIWKREWLPTPVFLPGEFHGQRSLVGYSLWGCKELNTTEWLTLSLFLSWKTVWRFLKELGINLPYDPGIPFLDI